MNVTSDSKIDTADTLSLMEKYVENKDLLIIAK